MSHPTPEQLKRNKKIAAVLLVLAAPGYFIGTWAKDELKIRECMTMAATHSSGNALADVMIASMDTERMCRHYQRKAKAQAKLSAGAQERYAKDVERFSAGGTFQIPEKK